MNKYLFMSMLVALPQSSAAVAPERDVSRPAAFDEALAGRTAGEPQSCVVQRNVRGKKGLGEDAILFTMNSPDLVYVNRPSSGCPALTGFRAMRTDKTANRLCRGDFVTIYKPGTRIEYGSCRLGDFVPYEKP